MLSRTMAKTIAIVGAGRVGQSLARALRRRGYRIGAVVARSTRSAHRAVKFIGAGKPLARVEPALLAANVVLVATPDGQVAEAAGALARLKGGWRGKVVLHTSGALSASALARVKRCGAAVGSLHPIWPFPKPIKILPEGIVFGIDGDLRARRQARTLVRALGGVPMEIRAGEKALYHAAAALVAGHLMTLIDLGTRMLRRTGVAEREARQALLPLVQQTVAGYARLGTRAWTGPLERGDADTVRRHMKALRRLPPVYRRVYAALAEAGVELFRRDRSQATRALRRVLKKVR